MAITINRKEFFDAIRAPLFPKGLPQKAVDGCEFIISTWERSYQDRTPMTQFANVLGTTFLETGATMQPIHEFGNRDYFMRMYDKTGARPAKAVELGNTMEGDGERFAGRGYVQLTGRANYRKATRMLRTAGIIGPDIDFEANPDLVMKPDYAAHIMFLGMEEGLFTGRKLDDLVDVEADGDEHADFVKARAIINGTDRAENIADYSDSFLAALRKSLRFGAPAGEKAPAQAAPKEDAPKAETPAAPPAPAAPTAANPEPPGWFEHLLQVMRSHRKP